MAATLDSENVFRARISALGLDEALSLALVNAGVNSMSKLAFICGIQPGAADDQPFVTAIYEILQRDSTQNPIATLQIAILRRLWFESHTCVMSEVKSRLEQTEDSLPKKLPLAEREARRRTQVAKLSGVDLSGHLEPAHSLVDFVWSLRESETLKYVDPSKCGSRENEIKGQKKETFLRMDSAGKLITVQRAEITQADTSTEYRLRIALQRRSLALDQVDILPYEISEKYHEELFALTMRPVPPTHSPISTSQILEADRTAWARCAQICREGLSPVAGRYPLAEALASVRSDPVVVSILQPLVKPMISNNTHTRPTPYDNNRSNQLGKGMGDSGFKGDSGTKGGKRGRGKGSFRSGKGGKPSGKGDWLPNGLKGRSKTRSGERICYNFNLQSCQTNGNKCDKGVHVCCFCNEAHPYLQCPKRN